jgi:hypothetical protein
MQALYAFITKRSLELDIFSNGVHDLMVCRFRTIGIHVDEVVVDALGDDDLLFIPFIPNLKNRIFQIDSVLVEINHFFVLQ